MAKSILITGCSDNGLGAALALAFKKAGYRVIASARNLNKLGQVTAAGCETVKLDVTSQESLTACAEELSKKLDGKLDILLNNAGAMALLPVTDLKLKDVRDCFELNTFSLISITQTFLPMLRAAPNGWIVNNTSCAAVFSLPMQSAYNASKAAASSITQALRLELEPFGIKVIELRTGAVKTAVYQNATEGSNKLPADSLYAAAKDEIEAGLNGAEMMKGAHNAQDWAANVVHDLSTSNPPMFIYRGATATMTQYGSALPLWMFDGMMKKAMGLDIFKARLDAAERKVD